MKITPDQLFPGYTANSTEIRIPLASLGLSETEANGVTGNAMEVLRKLVELANSQIANLAPTARPTKVTIIKQNPSIASGAQIPGTLRQTYTINFDLQPTALELAAEPTL